MKLRARDNAYSMCHAAYARRAEQLFLCGLLLVVRRLRAGEYKETQIGTRPFSARLSPLECRNVSTVFLGRPDAGPMSIRMAIPRIGRWSKWKS